MKGFLPVVILFVVIAPAAAATLNGSQFALRSTGQSAGNSWVLDRNGYVGTYITLAQPGNVTVTVNADGSSSPNMNVVLADAKASFSVAIGSRDYSHTYSLPAGTYFLRTELNNDRGDAARQLKINNLTISGASLANTNNNANALAASDSYIANFRKGNARVRIPGAASGSRVQVSLKRLDFTLGASVDWNMDPLLTDNSAAAQNFRATLNKNFNTVATDNEMWEATESVRGRITMSQADRLFAYAEANGLQARMHNMIWEQVQPQWVNALRTQAAGGDIIASASLRDAISDRIKYYIGDGAGGNADRAKKYFELDVYNESYHSGQLGPSDSYWNIYGAPGIADIYSEAKRAVESSGAATKLFVNDYNVLDDPNYMNGFMQHVDTLRQAALDGGKGEIVGGIGLQYYKNNLQEHQASRFIASLQNANVQGIPTQLSEFGGFSGLAPDDAAKVLDESLRLMFGNAGSIGFLNWYWIKENQGQGQFAPYASLYTVDTNNWGNLQITPAGKAWQDRLGIQDWDGNPNNAWTTETTATVGADGSISFNGYYGDYELTVDGKTYKLSTRKGTVDYLLDTSMLEGDFNGDGRVDAADYAFWRDHLGTNNPLSDNGNESGASAGVVDHADYNLWKTEFGADAGAGAASGAAIPEPKTLGAAVLAALLFVFCRPPRVATS
ncbi:MAG: endo-1,4-beta-xylanase [Pirellulales bacterium]